MAQSIRFIIVKITHGYYKDVTGKFYILPTIETGKLMRDRGMLFRQTDDGCLCLIASDCRGFLLDDQLEFVLQVKDADFMRVTQLDDYQPQTFYRLRLPDESRRIDVISTLVPANNPMGAHYFCSISVKPTYDMLAKAQCGRPFEYQLRFREMAYCWEYLFIPRCEDIDESKVLLLEDTKGKILFTLPEKLANTLYGKMAWRIVSASPVVCQQHPDCNLQLSDVLTAELCKLLIEKLNSKGLLTPELEKDIQSGEFSKLPTDVVSEAISDKSLKKRTLNRFLPSPQPGQYKTEERDCMRQVCYF